MLILYAAKLHDEGPLMSDKTAVILEDLPTPFIGCHAVRSNGYCFCPVAVSPVSTNGVGNSDSLLAQFPRGAAYPEAKEVLETASRSLAALGSSLSRGTKIDQLTTHPTVAASYLEVRAGYMDNSSRPASTNFQVAGFVNPSAVVGIQLIAHAGSQAKEPVVVPGMPASPPPPMPPAAHAIIHGDFLFVTGQVSYDFADGYPAVAEIDNSTWFPSKAISETRYIIKKIARILEFLGGNLSDCVRLEIYLNDITDVVGLEKLFGEAFGDEMPARTFIPTVRLAPTLCCVEIAAICRRPGARKKISRLSCSVPNPDLWLAPTAVEYNGFIFTSSFCGNLIGNLRTALPLADQVAIMFEKVATLEPLRGSGIEKVLFAGLQIATDVDLSSLRWHLQQINGQERIAISPIRIQPPLLWIKGGVQADFICAAN
jgi:2-iminobutanoate/2-iminopropanoate deaminase